jgi:hypothetical protein
MYLRALQIDPKHIVTLCNFGAPSPHTCSPTPHLVRLPNSLASSARQLLQEHKWVTLRGALPLPAVACD